MSKPFQVLAGKYEAGYSDDENIKYSDELNTLDDALTAYSQVNDYPWARIEYRGWKIEGRKA